MTEYELADGYRWINREDTDDYLTFKNHEPEVTQLLSKQHGRSFLDVGAHVGRYSVRCAKNFKTVWAWEPGASQRDGLNSNLIINGITNVIVVPFAAWNENETVGYVTREKNAQATVGAYNGTMLPVEARRVESIVPHADVIKIDVEGAEVEVLEGMRSLLIQRPRPKLFIEIHDWVDKTIPDKCRELIKPYGYSIREFDVHGEVYWECSGLR